MSNKLSQTALGLILLGLLFIAISCASHECPCMVPAHGGLKIKVMSFNIRYGTANDGENRWENRKEMVFDTIRQNNPDVLGMQEALRFQIDAIREALPEYSETGVGRDDGKTKGEYAPILYRTNRFEAVKEGTFWFSSTPSIPGSAHWGNTIPRICSWVLLKERTTGRMFYMYNLHIDHRSQPSRLKSVELLAQRIAQRDPVEPFLVTGDFNAGEDNPVIQYLKGKISADEIAEIEKSNPTPLRDAYRVLHPDAEEVGTFNGFKGERTGDKIDFILIPDGIEVSQAEIDFTEKNGHYPSDHFPVTGKLILP